MQVERAGDVEAFISAASAYTSKRTGHPGPWLEYKALTGRADVADDREFHELAARHLLVLEQHDIQPDPDTLLVDLLDTALTHSSRALELLGPDEIGGASHSSTLADRSLILGNRWFRERSHPELAADGLDCIEKALKIGHPSAVLRCRWLSNAVSSYSDAGFVLSSVDLLDRGVALGWRGLADRPDKDDELAVALHSLSEILSTRFSLTGDSDDLDEAIVLGRRAVAESAGTAHEERCEEGLASRLAERWRITGAAEDMEQAIALSRAIWERSRNPRVARNIALRLGRYYSTTGDPLDLIEAEQFARIALDATGADEGMAVGRMAIWVARVAALAGTLGRYDLVSDALRESTAMLGSTALDQPDRSMLAFFTSRLVDTTLGTRYEVPGFDRQRKIILAREGIHLVKRADPVWADRTTWVVHAVLLDGEARTSEVVDPATLRELADLLVDVLDTGHLNPSVLSQVARLLESFDNSGIRHIAAALPAAVSRWLAPGMSADRTELASSQLAGLSAMCTEARLQASDGSAVQRDELVEASIVADSMRAYWLTRLAETAAAAQLDELDPDLAAEWNDLAARLGGLQQPRGIGPSTADSSELLVERRALLRRVVRVVPEFGATDSARDRQHVIDLSESRPLCVLSPTPDGLRAIVLADGEAETALMPFDRDAVAELVAIVQHSPSRFAAAQPALEAAHTLHGLLAAAGRELASMLSGLAPSGPPAAIIGDGLTRSLPWAAVPLGNGRTVGDVTRWTFEPSLSFVKVTPTPVPPAIRIVDGDLGVTLPSTRVERQWLQRERAATVVDLENLPDPSPGGHLLHVLAHGSADELRPRESGFRVTSSRGDSVTVRASDLAATGQVPAMAILSACSMAYGGWSPTASNLAAPVTDTLRAIGVGSVAGYLSPCSDRIAALLAIRVHQELAQSPDEGLEPAVRAAQLWARSASDHELDTWADSVTDGAIAASTAIRDAAVWGAMAVTGW